jgi:uncharacterized membrane protein YgaE (UPF0421/DUF939 family)
LSSKKRSAYSVSKATQSPKTKRKSKAQKEIERLKRENRKLRKSMANFAIQIALRKRDEQLKIIAQKFREWQKIQGPKTRFYNTLDRYDRNALEAAIEESKEEIREVRDSFKLLQEVRLHQMYSDIFGYAA